MDLMYDDIKSSVSMDKVENSETTTTVYRVDAHSSTLCQALYKLTVNEPQFCDVILRLNNSKREFKAHSSVLATCSAFFKSILSKPDNQFAKNVVVLLPDFIRANGLEPILLFVYTGDLGISDESVSSIYQVACLFELSGAINLCHKYAEARRLPLSVLNAVQSEVSLLDSETKQSTEKESENLNSNKENCTKTENVDNLLKNEITEEQHEKISTGEQQQEEENYDEMSVESQSSDEKEMEADTLDEDNNNYRPTRRSLRKTRLNELKSKTNCVVPVRRSARKLKPKSNSTLNNDSKNNNNRKKKIQKGTKWAQGKVQKVPNDTPPPSEDNKIDPNLKYTDPAKYISELIDKNSDMLKDRGTDSESGGGVKVVTRGKITYIYPEGYETTIPEPNAPAVEANTKINEAGLPYEKIVDPLTCGECNIAFPSADLREAHINDKHKNHSNAHVKQVVFQCLNCPFSTDFLRNMWFHCHWKHGHPLPDTLRQYCCGLCDYRAPAQGNIEVHIRRVHTHERPLMCDVCGQFFKSLDTLRGHRFYRHQDFYPFQCNVCEKQFKRRHKLEVHMRIHMGYKPFSCPECPYATYTKFNLKDHVRKRHLKELESTQ